MTADFTMLKYKQLCIALLNSDYHPLTLLAYLEGNTNSTKLVILRHDVDRKPANALAMAELENRLGIQSTYYFRYPYTFEPKIIKKILDFGHEVGYHYEVLSKSKGDYNKAIDLFSKELNEFRKICNVQTICMHGSPLSGYDNRDIWKIYDFQDFGICGEAYLSVDRSVNYFSDTGRSWNWKNKMRDFIPNKRETMLANSTIDLINLIEGGKANKFYILAHPERWACKYTEWIINYIKDLVINEGKGILRDLDYG